MRARIYLIYFAQVYRKNYHFHDPADIVTPRNCHAVVMRNNCPSGELVHARMSRHVASFCPYVGIIPPGAHVTMINTTTNEPLGNFCFAEFFHGERPSLSGFRPKRGGGWEGEREGFLLLLARWSLLESRIYSPERIFASRLAL